MKAPLSLLLALSLSTVAQAQFSQTVQPDPGYLRTLQVAPGELQLRHVVYDVQQDRVLSVTSLPSGSQAFGSSPCYDNSDVFFDVDLVTYIVSDPGTELVAWGVKRCTGAGRLRNVTLFYVSEAIDASAGGPGGTLQFALYGGTTGFGSPGTELFRRTITGLPSGSVFGNYLTLDFGTEPLPLGNGPIGWGFLQLDGDTGPARVRAPRGLLGTIDGLDFYSPGPASAATYVGTFNYGGATGCHCANMFIQLDEIADDEVAETTVVNGSGVNPVLLEEVFPPRVGHFWVERVDVPQVGGVGTPPFTVLATTAGLLPAPVATPFGELLVDRGLTLIPPQFEEGTYYRLLPSDLSLVGYEFYTQAAVLPPSSTSITLTNALRHRIGY